MQPVISALSWRYATKKFDPQKKLTTEQVNHLIACTQLTPPSYGLQPWKIMVAKNPEPRQRAYSTLGLTSTIVCPVGYRSPEDALATKKKVRLPVDELSIFIR